MLDIVIGVIDPDEVEAATVTGKEIVAFIALAEEPDGMPVVGIVVVAVAGIGTIEIGGTPLVTGTI